MRSPAVAAFAVAFALAPGQASAAITSVLAGHTISGNGIPCAAQTDGVRVCHGTDGGGGAGDLRFKTFDGAPLEIYVILPPTPASGTDGNYPLIFQSHGWGGSAGGPNDTEFYGPTADALAKDGYAVVQLTARGFGDSCGKAIMYPRWRCPFCSARRPTLPTRKSSLSMPSSVRMRCPCRSSSCVTSGSMP